MLSFANIILGCLALGLGYLSIQIFLSDMALESPAKFGACTLVFQVALVTHFAGYRIFKMVSFLFKFSQLQMFPIRTDEPIFLCIICKF